jgi:hypothetical protein
MKWPCYVLAFGVLLLNGCGNSQNSPPPATPPGTNAPKQQAAPAEGGGYLGGLASGQAKAVATVDVASLTQAVSMFNVDEGRYPKSLQELVDKKYIGQIPPAPYGKKLDYDPATGVVKVVAQ